MDPFIYGLLLAAAAFSVFAASRVERRMALHAGRWEETARRTGLEVLLADDSSPVGVSGTINGIAVSAHLKPGSQMILKADFAEHAARRLSLHKISEETPRAGVLIGDPRFDPLVRVDGDELRALAVLDVDTRKKAVRLIHEFGMNLDEGVLEHTESPRDVEPERVASLIELMRRFAECMMLEDREIAQCLLDNAQVEPLPPVRNRMLQLLFEYAPKSPAAKVALVVLDEIPVDPIVNIAGYLALGTEGANRLLAVVEDSPSEVHRAYATRLLVRAYRGQFIQRLLEVVMEDPATEVRRGAVLGIGEAGRQRYEGGLPELCARILDEGGDHHAVLWSLERVSISESEGLLIRLLESPEVDVRRRTARILGEVGGRDAVVPLKAVGQNRFADRELKRQIEDALLKIRGRLGEAAQGGLSVLEPEEQVGQLSLEDEGGEGALSYAVESGGRLEFATPRSGDSQTD